MNDDIGLYIFHGEKWTRRVCGVFGNQVARSSASCAHAILTQHVSGIGYQVSVRVSLNTKEGAMNYAESFQ